MTASKTRLIRSSEDVVRIRSEVRNASITAGFSLVDQTKFVTAASELARNMVIYAAGGEMQIELLESSGRKGVRLAFIDQGPGIPDIEQAMNDGFTTGTGLGLGLGGARRLSNEFTIDSKMGHGTRVTIARWK
jgi:serine/threonine-protein kinase RsbT